MPKPETAKIGPISVLMIKSGKFQVKNRFLYEKMSNKVGSVSWAKNILLVKNLI